MVDDEEEIEFVVDLWGNFGERINLNSGLHT